jgi:hypothetical protein
MKLIFFKGSIKKIKNKIIKDQIKSIIYYKFELKN